MHNELDLLNDEVEDLEGEIFTKQQVFKKLLVNMYSFEGSDREDEDD